MTDQELKDIVAAVVAELEKSGVDFDYKADQAKDDDLVFVIRGTAPNYQGVTVTWKGLLDIITAQATQAKNDAETAKNAANTILEQVQSKGTEITNFVATSKTEIETQKNESVNAVKSVYQTDLDELKGDLIQLSKIEEVVANLFNIDTVIDNMAIVSDGTIYAESGFMVSDYIPVDSNSIYSLYGSNNTVVCYDDNGNVCQTRAIQTQIKSPYFTSRYYTVTLPTDCVKVRLGVHKGDYNDGFYFAKGNVNAFYRYNRPVYNEKSNLKKGIIVDGGQISPYSFNAKLMENNGIYNYLDYNNEFFADGLLDPATGESISTTSGVHCSGYIMIPPNTTLYIGGGFYLGGGNYAFYDDQKGLDASVVTSYDSSNKVLTATTGVNTRYVRLCSWESKVPNGYISPKSARVYDANCHMDNVSNLTERNVLIFGDSISTGASSNRAVYGQSYGQYDKWVDNLINDRIFEYHHTTNDSIHATGFVQKLSVADGGRWLNGENNFNQRLQYYVSNNKCNNYDEVIVFGGINDYLSSVPLNDFKNAVDSFFSSLTTNFVHARIVVILPLKVDSSTNSGGITYDDYYSYLKQVAESYSIPCLDTKNMSGFNPRLPAFKNMWTYNSDGIHPNDNYQKKFLTGMIKNYLELIN